MPFYLRTLLKLFETSSKASINFRSDVPGALCEIWCHEDNKFVQNTYAPFIWLDGGHQPDFM